MAASFVMRNNHAPAVLQATVESHLQVATLASGGDVHGVDIRDAA
jgi:hypothetical protein